MRANLLGQVFGKLEVVEELGQINPRNAQIYWKCVCQCGGEARTTTSALRSGHTASCGCLQKQRAVETHTKHGATKFKGANPNPLYHHWENMKSRCLNPKSPRFHRYGGRGIAVCDRWLEFMNFNEDMAESYFEGATLERKEVNGNYCKENCEWITGAEQSRNKSDTVYVEHQGQQVNLSKWFYERAGQSTVSYSVFRNRVLAHSWDLETALIKEKRPPKVAKEKIPRKRYLGPDKLLKSCLKILGGKLTQYSQSPRSRVYALTPSGIRRLVESFLGAGQMFMGQKKFEDEWVGDTMPYVPLFFNVVQKYPDEFWERLQQEPPLSAERFAYLRKNPPVSDPIGLAVWFYLISKHALNGVFRTSSRTGVCNSTYCGTSQGRGLLDRDWLDRIVERIQGVHIKYTDFRSLVCHVRQLPDYVPSETLFIFDPPYANTKRTPNTFKNYWMGTFTWKDQEELADLFFDLTREGAKCLVTLNDTPEVRSLYERPGAHFVAHEVFYSCSATDVGRGLRPELIIINYEAKINAESNSQ